MQAQRDPAVWAVIPALVGAMAALLTAGATARGWFRRTIGRRRDRYSRLARLGVGAQLSFFESVLGEPPAISRSVVKKDYAEWISPEDPEFQDAGDEAPQREVARTFVESIFIDRDFYVQTITDADKTVLAFSVTTRSRRFTPTYEVHPPLGLLGRVKFRRRWGHSYRPLVHVRLGRTKFADLDDPDPDNFAGPHFRVSMGAHNYDYSEFTYFGNPGSYQSFVWTASDVTGVGELGNAMAVHEEIDGTEWPDPEKEGAETDWEEMHASQSFRRMTTITTYTVVHAALWVERNYPLSRFGPHINDVRTLP